MLRSILGGATFAALLILWGASTGVAQDASPADDEATLEEGAISSEEAADEEATDEEKKDDEGEEGEDDGAGGLGEPRPTSDEGEPGDPEPAGDPNPQPSGVSDLDGATAEAADGMADEAEGEEGEDAFETEEERASWAVSGSVNTSVGQGSFVQNSYARNPYVAWTFSFSPSYTFEDGTKLSAGLGVSQELTESDGATKERQALLSDVSLGVSRKLFTIPVAEIVTSGSASVYLPTSLASRYTRLMFAGALKLGLSRSFETDKAGTFGLGYSLGFRKNFHKYTSPVVDVEGFDQNVLLAREGGAERVGAFLISPGGNNTSFSLTNGFSASWSPIENLTTTISYNWANGWTYNDFPEDEMSSPYAEGGRGRREAYSAGIGASYSFAERYQLSGGILTAGSQFTADNKHIRFPFWDFRSEADNLSTFYVAFAATLDGTAF